MAGLIVLLLFFAWLFISIKITSSIINNVNIKLRVLLGVIIFPFIIVLPFADEIIGRIQFHNLCDKEAVVFVSPNAKDITAAKSKTYMTELTNFIFPITQQSVIYTDAYTGNEFYKFKAFHTPGGFIMRAGLGMGNSSSCWPENWSTQKHGIDIDALIKRGKNVK